MKLLKPGNGQKSWSIKRKCTGKGNGNDGCGAELLIELDDLYFTYSFHYDGSNERYVTFRCSECEVQTDVYNLPPQIIRKIGK